MPTVPDAGLPAPSWLLQVALVLLATVVIDLLTRRLLGRADAALQQTPSPWDEALVRAARRPLSWGVWGVGVASALHLVHVRTGSPLLDAIGPLRDLTIVSCVAWFLVRLIRNLTDHLLHEADDHPDQLDPTTIDALSKLARLVVVVGVCLAAAQAMGVSLSGLLAAGGISGVAVGFAAKDLLANFFGGLTIYLDRPFAVGDWVRSPDKDIEGTVEHISWRHTRIRRFNKNPLYVPNAAFTTIAVENPSRMTHRRLKATLGLRYADLAQVDAIVADLREALARHPDVDATQTVIVNLDALGPSSVDLLLYAFTRETEWASYQALKQEVLLTAARVVADHGASFAFPTRTVHLERGDDA